MWKTDTVKMDLPKKIFKERLNLCYVIETHFKEYREANIKNAQDIGQDGRIARSWARLL